MSTNAPVAATVGGVWTQAISILANNLSTVNNVSIAANNLSHTAVIMSEGFMKLSAIEQDLKLREATAALAVKTEALSALLGVEIAAPIQPKPKPALQM